MSCFFKQMGNQPYSFPVLSRFCNGLWNRTFQLFLFFKILGQPREVRPKFRNEILENVLSIRSPTQKFPEFLVKWKVPLDLLLYTTRVQGIYIISTIIHFMKMLIELNKAHK